MENLFRAAKIIIESLLFLLLSVGPSPAVQPAGAVYYVAPDGSDSNPGTLAQPWQTISKANRELRPGDTVFLRAGNYYDVIKPAASGTRPDTRIRYVAFPGEVASLRGSASTEHVVDLENRSYVVIDGLVIGRDGAPPTQDPRWSLVIISGSHAQHNIIRNCTIQQPGDPYGRFLTGYREIGILIQGADHNVVEHNLITGVWQGVKLQDLAQYNIIADNLITATSGESIVLNSSKGVIQGNLIQGNTLEGSVTSDGIQTHADYDLTEAEQATDLSNRGIIIRDNVIRYHGENGIDLKAASNVVVEGNIIYGTIGSNNGPMEGWNRNAQGAIGRGARKSSADIIIRNNLIYDNSGGIKIHRGYKIYHNTVVANNRDYTGADSDWSAADRPAFWAILQRDMGEGGIAIQNNILAGHSGVEVVLRLTHVQSETNHIDSNLYYGREGAFFADYRAKGDWDRLTFRQWQHRLRDYASITGQDAASLVADPMFVAAPEKPVGERARSDFYLRAGSPAIDAGGPLTRVVGSGNGTRIRVLDARYFCDGFGVTEGDLVKIGQNHPVRILAVDYDTDWLTIDRSISWQDGAWVTLPYSGEAPDLGAYECVGECTAAPAPAADVPDVVRAEHMESSPAGNDS